MGHYHFGPASGADAVMLRMAAGGDWPKRAGKGPVLGKPAASGGRLQLTALALGDAKVEVLTLSAAGKHPAVSVDGDAVAVGGQRIVFSGGRLSLQEVRGPMRTGN